MSDASPEPLLEPDEAERRRLAAQVSNENLDSVETEEKPK